MAENSKIEWTDHTFNPWIGCQKVSPGCDHCYAEALMDHRYRKVTWGPHGERVRTAPANWKKPLQWAKAAKELDRRPRVFCASLADVFDNKAPNLARFDLFSLIWDTPELDWLLLTKRPENIKKMLPDDWGAGYPNVWLGTTCEDQAAYDRRWPILREVPARVRFISYEPAIGPLFVDKQLGVPDWVICGGESGAGARFMQPDWARDLKNQCGEVGVSFFMKQFGSLGGYRGKGDDISRWPEQMRVREFPA